MQFRDLHRQYEAMRTEMDAALLNAAHSGAYIMGPQVAELEQRLADYVGVKHCITCANGTDALRLSLMAIGIGPGDAVFVPDFTFFATAEAVAMVGATPIFIDVCKDTYNIDATKLCDRYNDALNRELSPRAVIAVDLFGQPADYKMLSAFCKEHNLFLVEDGAQGFGGSINGKKACSFGDISTTSFFPAKPRGCYGDGGALFTDSDDWAALLRSYRIHGKGSDKYDNVRIGLNSRLDTLQAAVLLVKMNHLDEELKSVNHVAQTYNEMLHGKVTIPQISKTYTSSWAQYTIQAENRNEIQGRLKAAGIPSMVYYPRTMSQQTAFINLGQQCQPVAKKLTQTALSLPMHPYLTDGEIEHIASLI